MNNKKIGISDRMLAAGIVLLVTVIILSAVAIVSGQNLFGHNVYDSYTRQALAWREGRTYLISQGSELDYLELAEYNGNLYVSFPPVPSIPEFFLTFLFGLNTPNNLLIFIYCCVSAVAVTLMFSKYRSVKSSVVLGLLFSMGTNLISSFSFGGVWHEAQSLSFMLCSLACLFIMHDDRKHKIASLICAALAVGCRPFTVLFIPFLLYRCFVFENKELKSMIAYLIGPAIIAVSYMIYNFVRFDSFFEFGHNYLPEFIRAENGQFSFSYLLPNLWQAIKLPVSIGKNGVSVALNRFSANTFYAFNPCIAVFAYIIIKNIIKKHEPYDILFFGACIMFVLFTCMHRTLGGLQFGARYFIDFIPFMAYYMSKKKFKVGQVEYIITAFAVILNTCGGMFFS